MSWPAATPEIRWTVTVTGRSARGLLRDSTSYSTKHARDDAEQAGLALAVSKWPASTVPVKLSSYASVHVVRPDQDWREICQWRERSLEGESQSEHESNERPRCGRCGHLLNLRTGRCWACGRTQEEWESEKAAMEEVDVDNVTELRSSSEDRDLNMTIGFPDGTKVPFGHFDQESGEFAGDHPLLRQPTLDPTIFPAIERRQVPMVKVGFSGSVEMTQSEWEGYCDQGLEPGRMVKLTLTGYLPDPHSRWVKRTEKREDGEKETWWEQEGQIRVRVTELGRFEVTGVYDGD